MSLRRDLHVGASIGLFWAITRAYSRVGDPAGGLETTDDVVGFAAGLRDQRVARSRGGLLYTSDYETCAAILRSPDASADIPEPRNALDAILIGPMPPEGRQLSHEESLADAGRITHLIVNPARTECFDGNGDGVSDGLAIVVEPRDGDERLVTAAGDVSISVYDPAGPTGAAPLARWDIPAHEAIGRFRRTSRNRGLHFVLRWPGPPPRGDYVQVQVSLTTFEAASFQADCTVAVQPRSGPLDTVNHDAVRP